MGSFAPVLAVATLIVVVGMLINRPARNALVALVTGADKQQKDPPSLQAADSTAPDYVSGAEARPKVIVSSSVEPSTFDPVLVQSTPVEPVSVDPVPIEAPPVDPAAMKAFAELKARLEQASHFPTRGIDVVTTGTQRGELCFVGDAPIDIDVPHETWDRANQCVLTCTKQSAAEAKWKIGARVLNQGDLGFELGTVSIDASRKLVIELPALPRESSQDHVRARAALACSVLRITSAPEGSGTPPPEATTFVQIAEPIREGAVVFKTFFEGDGTTYPPRQASAPSLKRYRIPDALPAEWPMRCVFAGTCGTLVGSMATGRSVDMKLARGTAGMSIDTPWTWSMTWSWTGEPIVTTDFALGNRQLEVDGLIVKVFAGTLAEVWNTRDRLVTLDAKKLHGQPDFEFVGFPTQKIWEVQTSTVLPSGLHQIVLEVINELKRKRGKQVPGGFSELLKRDPPQSLAEWRETLLGKPTQGDDYVQWVDKKCPPPTPPSGDAKPEQVQDFQQKRAVYEQRVANDFPVSKYREELHRNFAEASADPYEVLIYRCCKRLAEIEKGKEQVRALLIDGLGYRLPNDSRVAKNVLPDAVLTGEIVFEFKSVGDDCRAVLMSFGKGADPKSAFLGARTRPVMTDLESER